MAQFVAISLSVTKEHIAHVHRAGCSDIAKTLRSGSNVPENIEAPNAKAAVAAYLAGDLDEMGYMAQDVKILSCAK